MLAIVSLVCSILSFCMIGAFQGGVAPSQIWLLLVTLLSIVVFGALEEYYRKPKLMFRIHARDMRLRDRAYWPVTFVIATWIWMNDPMIGVAVLVAAIPFLKINILNVYFNHTRKVNDSRALKGDLQKTPYDLIIYASDGAYQVNQWIPVLEALPFRIVICACNFDLAKSIGPTDVPVVYARTMEMVSQLISSGARGVLYPTNKMQNVQAFRHMECKHIFINHGESDKVVNQSKFLLSYDYLFVGAS